MTEGCSAPVTRLCRGVACRAEMSCVAVIWRGSCGAQLLRAHEFKVTFTSISCKKSNFTNHVIILSLRQCKPS